jgi:hypothetical protein
VSTPGGRFRRIFQLGKSRKRQKVNYIWLATMPVATSTTRMLTMMNSNRSIGSYITDGLCRQGTFALTASIGGRNDRAARWLVYSAEELEFINAMQDYKRFSGRMFPTWSEALEVLRSLGYTKATD